MIIRKIKTSSPDCFLTFDDGPTLSFTHQVLDLLNSHKVQGTFFVIGEKAKRNRSLLEIMLKEGHAVMSHSSDHNYRHYFQGSTKVREWLVSSLDELQQLTGRKQVGFRPPAGVLTPPLLQAAKDLKIPLILWNHRFYDSIFGLRSFAIERSLKYFAAGDIVLLHDCQRQSMEGLFLKSLESYIIGLKNMGLQSRALEDRLIGQG